MAPAPTLQTQSRTEGHGPRFQIMDGPVWGLVLCAPFPGSTGPPGPDQGPERSELPQGRFDALLMQSIPANQAVYWRKPRQIGVEGPGSRTGDPWCPGDRTGRPEKAGERNQSAEQGERKALGSH